MIQPRLSRSARAATALALAAVASSVVLTACADADKATPETKIFPFKGRTLDVRTHETVVDLVARDREDVKVTRWFDVKPGADSHSTWKLSDGTLDLDAGCTGYANCDARFRVEVPKSVKVLRDGRATQLKGAGAAAGAPRDGHPGRGA